LLVVLAKNLASLPVKDPVAIIDRCWKHLCITHNRARLRDAAHKKAYIQYVFYIIDQNFPYLDEWGTDSTAHKHHVMQQLEKGFLPINS
jgi:hypothetical protein